MQTTPGSSLQTSTFDFPGQVNKWMAVITKPSEMTFQAEKPNANLVGALVWLVIAGAIYGLLAGLSAAIFRNAGFGGVIGGLLGGAIGLLIGFLVVQGIFYLVAHLLGGSGDFNTQAYLQSLFFAPLLIVDGVLSLIPFVGPLLILIAGLYSLYLTTLALKVAHNYSSGKAVLTWAIPVGVFTILGICAIAVFGIGLMALIGASGATGR